MRTMLRFPFSQVDGIELSEQLAGIARSNLKRIGQGRTTIYSANAVDFERYGSYSHYYFYNPFPGSVMEATLKRIQDADSVSGKFLIYNNPTCRSLVEAAGFVSMSSFRGGHNNVIEVFQGRETG